MGESECDKEGEDDDEGAWDEWVSEGKDKKQMRWGVGMQRRNKRRVRKRGIGDDWIENGKKEKSEGE